MNGKHILGSLIFVVGLLILLGGLAMPSTTTTTSTSCYDNPYSYGQDCVESTYETPNSSKGPAIIFGLVLTIAGGFVAKSGTSSDSRRTSQTSSSDSHWTGDNQVSETDSTTSEYRGASQTSQSPVDTPSSTDDNSNHEFTEKVREAHNERK